jgi:UDPglucose 6-dehydrogenase
LAEGVAGAEVIFLALPTPPNEDGSADLSYILGVADQLGPLIKDYTVVVNKSTVPVGTSEQVRTAIGNNISIEFDVVSNPEFLREGCAVEDFMKPNRIVIGSSSEKALGILKKLYEPITKNGTPIFFMDERSAELTKYAANSFLAAKISFMNEIANLCSLLGADVDSVRLGIGSDERIGQKFLFPGIGYGGSCFPKDVQALQNTASENGYQFKVLDALIEVNDHQKRILFEKVKTYYGNDLKGKTFALWGLSYKPDTDDIREAPSIYIIDDLIAAGASVQAYDPEAMDNIKKHYDSNSGLTLTENQYKALTGADALVIVTEWPVFKEPDFDLLAKELKSPVIFDGRNIFNPSHMRERGFYYESIGRPIVKP